MGQIDVEFGSCNGLVQSRQQAMVWMMIRSLMYIRVTRPQWVKIGWYPCLSMIDDFVETSCGIDISQNSAFFNVNI